MRVLLQRVKRALVTVNGIVSGQIDEGLLIFVGITHDDTENEVKWLCEKILKMRIFEDENGKMNRNVEEISGGILVVSQFTLYGDAQKGNRPSFISAAHAAISKPLYEKMVYYLRQNSKLQIESGIFAAVMDVELINDGPVTIILEKNSKKLTDN